MSLDAWEKHALNSIAHDLAASAPELASCLSVFNRLASGEQMPEEPGAKAEARRGHRRGLGVRAAHSGTWPVIPVVALMAVTTAIMIAVALVLSSGDREQGRAPQTASCAQSWPVPCPGP